MSAIVAPGGHVLVTGAGGYIGRRLVPLLVERGYRVRCLARDPALLPLTAWKDVSTVAGDALDEKTVTHALEGVDAAYYLIHSLGHGTRNFAELDRRAAQIFADAAARQGVRRIIYLGGLGEDRDNLSAHLASRQEVGRILLAGPAGATVLRAAIILGAGGASFEMLRSLVERLPFMIAPRWVESRCQPIGLDDVLGYLVACLQVEGTHGRSFDIGGPEILTYQQMLERVAALEERFTLVFTVPPLAPRLSAQWIRLVTPVPASVALPLIEGLRNEVICRENDIRALVPIPLTSFNDAVRQALREDKALPVAPTATEDGATPAAASSVAPPPAAPVAAKPQVTAPGDDGHKSTVPVSET
jgi:uncharacterized protein YbjT (DUF2867 family)